MSNLSKIMGPEDPMRAISMVITGSGLDMSRSCAGGNSVVATSTHDHKTQVEDSV